MLEQARPDYMDPSGTRTGSGGQSLETKTLESDLIDLLARGAVD